MRAFGKFVSFKVYFWRTAKDPAIVVFLTILLGSASFFGITWAYRF